MGRKTIIHAVLAASLLLGCTETTPVSATSDAPVIDLTSDGGSAQVYENNCYVIDTSFYNKDGEIFSYSPKISVSDKNVSVFFIRHT